MILIKVFDNEKWARHFIESGEMRYSKPSFFHEYEDSNARRDKKEGLEGLITPVHGRELKANEPTKLFGIKTPDKHYELRVVADGDGVQLLDSFVEVTKKSEVYIYSMFLVEFDKPMLYKTIEAMNLDGNGKYCVMIHNPLEFSNRVKAKLGKQNKNVLLNKVNYIDFSTGNKEQIRLNYFTKDINYEGQNEVRFVIDKLDTDAQSEYKNYHCGNILDIAIITKVENALDYVVAFADDWKYKTLYFAKEKEYRFISYRGENE